jgi:DNA-binding IclR family transcriptional regulator
MARLFAGEKENKLDDVLRALKSHAYGLRESELAELLRWERRTVNNYLRELSARDLVFKDGRLWFADE